MDGSLEATEDIGDEAGLAVLSETGKTCGGLLEAVGGFKELIGRIALADGAIDGRFRCGVVIKGRRTVGMLKGNWEGWPIGYEIGNVTGLVVRSAFGRACGALIGIDGLFDVDGVG